MNVEAIPPEHGGPVRAVVPGWYATDSVKWLERIRVSAVEFDRPFQALDYRLAEAGEAGPGRSLGRIPVHSLVTEPADGEALRAGRATIHGVAWSGAGPVAAVDVRIDRGAWTPATITS